MNQAEFQRQVDAVIRFDEEQPMKRLCEIAKERGDKDSVVKLKQALLKLKKQKRKINEVNFDQFADSSKEQIICNLYKETSPPLGYLAKKYKIKIPVIIEILSRNGIQVDSENRDIRPVDKSRIKIFDDWLTENSELKLGEFDEEQYRLSYEINVECKKGHKFSSSITKLKRNKSCPFCSGKKNYQDYLKQKSSNLHTYKSNFSLIKQQINLRLSNSHSSRLSEIHEYCSNKGEVNFLNNKETASDVFSSETSFARFLLEKAIDSMYIDVHAEKTIDRLAHGIILHRMATKGWEILKNIRYENWLAKYKNEFEKFLMEIEESKEQIYFSEFMEQVDPPDGEIYEPSISKEAFDVIWPIAVQRSHLLPDPFLPIHEENVLLEKRIKERYGEKRFN